MNLLTPSQKRIAVLIANDLTPKEVAAKLGWTVCSIYHEINIIKQKLQAKTMVGIARVVFLEAALGEREL